MPATPDAPVVLLVEDEQAVRAVCARALARSGFEVSAAADGSSGLDIARNQLDRIDLLVIDVVLPGGDGVFWFEEIRSLHPALTPLFISGHGREDLAYGHHLPEDARLLTKPFQPPELVAAAREAVDAHDG